MWTRASSFRRFTDTNICAEPIGSVKMRKTRRKLSAHIRILSLQCRTVTDGDGSGTRPRQRRASKKTLDVVGSTTNVGARVDAGQAGRQAGVGRSQDVEWWRLNGAALKGAATMTYTSHSTCPLGCQFAPPPPPIKPRSHRTCWTGLDWTELVTGQDPDKVRVPTVSFAFYWKRTMKLASIFQFRRKSEKKKWTLRNGIVAAT